MSSKFSPLIVEDISDTSNSDRGSWKLKAHLHYEKFTVPAGFVTDFASVPRLPFIWLLFGDMARPPATLHDWLYTADKDGKHPVAFRALADDIFYKACVEEGVPKWKAWMMWLGIRIGGGSHWV